MTHSEKRSSLRVLTAQSVKGCVGFSAGARADCLGFMCHVKEVRVCPERSGKPCRVSRTGRNPHVHFGNIAGSGVWND